jgi:hypothetical protein
MNHRTRVSKDARVFFVLGKGRKDDAVSKRVGPVSQDRALHLVQ